MEEALEIIGQADITRFTNLFSTAIHFEKTLNYEFVKLFRDEFGECMFKRCEVKLSIIV